jgi:predicted amidohydrolase YtcJ
VTSVVIADAEVDGARCDVRIDGGCITAIGSDVPRREAELVDAAGGALLPGLHDHHVHLLAMAARVAGLDLDGCEDRQAVDDALARCSRDAPDGWERAGGYDEHRHGALHRHRLDAVAAGRPVRVQHRTGLSWVVSTDALVRLGIDPDAPGPDEPAGVERDACGVATGWLHRLDGWLATRLPHDDLPLDAVGRRLAGFGITGVTDATVAIGPDRLARLRAARLPQRLVVLGTDDADELDGWATLGPAKLVVDEYLGLDPDRLAAAIADHHRRRRPVAIHAVSRVETVAATTALLAAGTVPGDRIEHGSVLPGALDDDLARSGVTVVVQPALVAERGDHYLDAVEPADLDCLHRTASLQRAGVRLAAGSDAPVTTADPWVGIAAAATRRTRTGHVLGAAERVTPATALDWYLGEPLEPGGPPRRIAVGRVADLCLLDVPLATALAGPSAGHVRGTWIGGWRVHP